MPTPTASKVSDKKKAAKRSAPAEAAAPVEAVPELSSAALAAAAKQQAAAAFDADAAALTAALGSIDTAGRGGALDRLSFGYSPAVAAEAIAFHGTISAPSWVAERRRRYKRCCLKPAERTRILPNPYNDIFPSTTPGASTGDDATVTTTATIEPGHLWVESVAASLKLQAHWTQRAALQGERRQVLGAGAAPLETFGGSIVPSSDAAAGAGADASNAEAGASGLAALAAARSQKKKQRAAAAATAGLGAAEDILRGMWA
jgi:hypothetical protein